MTLKIIGYGFALIKLAESLKLKAQGKITSDFYLQGRRAAALQAKNGQDEQDYVVGKFKEVLPTSLPLTNPRRFTDGQGN